MMMNYDIPRTPSPPPPPPSPPEVAEPMDLRSERPVFPGNGDCDQSKTSSAPSDGGSRHNQVGTTVLRGIPIVSLFIDGKERLCLAQISNTLLKAFSYNEIHNRRVALGITCVQCTPVQLEILRRAGAMPISSRRCGMITKREAERLVKSFLEEHMPPKLPDNFAFCVYHSCGWGCKGSFLPTRYNSSRAKCIKCNYCNVFFSPNKFIFHFHRTPNASYRHPDAANFNSWRRHLYLDYEPITDQLMHAWEDVKAMFNGGSRKRVMPSPLDKPGDSLDGKRGRFNDLDLGPGFQKLPLSPGGMGSPLFPGNPGVQGMFGPNPLPGPFSGLPQGDNSHPMGDARRMLLTEMWKPKNLPYYNPLGWMWAKNLGMCSPNAFLRPGSDVTGYEQRAPPCKSLSDLAAVRRRAEMPMIEMTQGVPPNARSSAFTPVGNYTHSPRISPGNVSSAAQSPSVTSDRSREEYSDAMADDDEVDVDVENEDRQAEDSDEPDVMSPTEKCRSVEGKARTMGGHDSGEAEIDAERHLQGKAGKLPFSIDKLCENEAQRVSGLCLDTISYHKQQSPKPILG